MGSVEEEQIAEGLQREATWTTSSYPGGPETEISWPDGLDRTIQVEVVDPAVEEREQFIERMRRESLPTLYLAGPMSGLTDYNYPAFEAAARRLRDIGYAVINPAENHEGATDLPLEDYFAEDLPQVCRADAVAVLPGWQKSGGASIEVALARHLGHPVLDAETLEPYHETALQEAQRLVYGDRGDAYGHPADDLTRSGQLWAPILGLEKVEAWQVALCMIGVKISREVNGRKADNLTDIAGYVAVLEMIYERMPR